MSTSVRITAKHRAPGHRAEDHAPLDYVMTMVYRLTGRIPDRDTEPRHYAESFDGDLVGAA
jgi:hypothetical protein